MTRDPHPYNEARADHAALGRADHDRRTAEQYLADLAAETDRSLAVDPTRWSWVRSGYFGWRERGRPEADRDR